jgi:hypothetical protein
MLMLVFENFILYYFLKNRELENTVYFGNYTLDLRLHTQTNFVISHTFLN